MSWTMPALFLLLQLKDGASSDRTPSALSPYLKGFLSLADVASGILLPCYNITCACPMASRGWAQRCNSCPGCSVGASRDGWAWVGRWVGDAAALTVLQGCADPPLLHFSSLLPYTLNA